MLKKFFVFYFLLISLVSAKVYKPMDDLNWHYRQDTRNKPAKIVQEESFRHYQEFVAMDSNGPEHNVHHVRDAKKPHYLGRRNAERAMRAAQNNPVVSLYQYSKYDPQNEGIGFCFGRAMFVDLYLALNGLNRGSIKKAFVIGNMNSGDAEWGWHVTTIVQSLDHNKREIWLAIDPIFSRVMEVSQWYRETLKMSTNGKLRLYITESGKFAPDPSRYDEREIRSHFYNRYFTDMMRWFELNDVSKELDLKDMR